MHLNAGLVLHKALKMTVSKGNKRAQLRKLNIRMIVLYPVSQRNCGFRHEVHKIKNLIQMEFLRVYETCKVYCCNLINCSFAPVIK